MKSVFFFSLPFTDRVTVEDQHLGTSIEIAKEAAIEVAALVVATEIDHRLESEAQHHYPMIQRLEKFTQVELQTLFHSVASCK